MLRALSISALVVALAAGCASPLTPTQTAAPVDAMASRDSVLLQPTVEGGVAVYQGIDMFHDGGLVTTYFDKASMAFRLSRRGSDLPMGCIYRPGMTPGELCEGAMGIAGYFPDGRPGIYLLKEMRDGRLEVARYAAVLGPTPAPVPGSAPL